MIKQDSKGGAGINLFVTLNIALNIAGRDKQDKNDDVCSKFKKRMTYVANLKKEKRMLYVANLKKDDIFQGIPNLWPLRTLVTECH